MNINTTKILLCVFGQFNIDEENQTESSAAGLAKMIVGLDDW